MNEKKTRTTKQNLSVLNMNMNGHIYCNVNIVMINNIKLEIS